MHQVKTIMVMTSKLTFKGKPPFYQKYSEQNRKTGKIPHRSEPKDMQSITNIKTRAKKQEHHRKYQVNLAIIWYLADNTLAYVSHAQTEVEIIMEITWKLMFRSKPLYYHKYQEQTLS